MDLGIAGRRALVGGASSGLGPGQCRGPGGRRLPARPVVPRRRRARGGGRRSPVAIRRGCRRRWAPTRPIRRRRPVARAALETGPVEILVLNAGGPPPAGPTETDAAGWARAFQLLATTPIELANLLLPGMRAQGWGRIVAILSSGVRQPILDLVYSNAGRGALHGVVQDGRSHGGSGWGHRERGPARAPRRRPGSQASTPGGRRRPGSPLTRCVAGHLATIPAGRYGRPEELGAYVAWLASEKASYQTGTFAAIDGGLDQRPSVGPRPVRLSRRCDRRTGPRIARTCRGLHPRSPARRRRGHRGDRCPGPRGASPGPGAGPPRRSGRSRPACSRPSRRGRARSPGPATK